MNLYRATMSRPGCVFYVAAANPKDAQDAAQQMWAEWKYDWRVKVVKIELIGVPGPSHPDGVDWFVTAKDTSQWP